MRTKGLLLSALLLLALMVIGCEDQIAAPDVTQGDALSKGPRGGAAPGNANTLYNSIPQGLPQNLPSLGYQATATAEAGQYIALDEEDQTLGQVTVAMSSWSRHADWPAYPVKGYSHPITFTVYDVGDPNVPSVGSVIATMTKEVTVPWRPEGNNSPRCDFGPPFGNGWGGGDCNSGILFTVDFDFSDMGITLPDEVMYGVSFNTQTWGYNPIGEPGPYNSLNFAFGEAVTVGDNLESSDRTLWATCFPGFSTCSGTPSTPQGYVWAGFAFPDGPTLQPAVRIQAVPGKK